MYVFFFVLISGVLGANILYISPIPTHSHHIWNKALAYGLNKKGHNITMLTHNQEKSKPKNFHLILLEGMYDKEFETFSIDSLLESNPLVGIKMLFEFSKFVCEHDLASNGLTTLMKYPKDFKFDLIVFDVTYVQCLYPIIDRFNNPPVVGVTPFLLPPVYSHVFGNPLESAYMPIYSTIFTDTMNFKERLINFLLIYAEVIYRQYIAMPEEYALAKKYFGENTRSLIDIERNISILLANTDPNMEYPLDLPPNIIPVGGLQVQPAKSLPEDLQQIMNNAKTGVVVFSLGSYLRSDRMSIFKRTTILNALSKLPQTVVWKFETESLTDVPKNVIIRKWLPQSDLLGMTDTKLEVYNLDSLLQSDPLVGIKMVYEFSKFVCEHDLATDGLKTLMKYPEDFKFDLIVIDLTGVSCVYPIIDRFNKPPVVGVTPFLLPPVHSRVFGNPLEPAYMPVYSTIFTDRMNFKERLINFFLMYADVIYRHYISLPDEQVLANTYFGENTRPLVDIERNISILLANTDPHMEYPLDLPPNIIPVGGLHAQPAKPLPEDLQQFMNNAKNGVVVFSLGSFLRSDQMSESKRTTILNALAKLPQHVLWKFETENTIDLPKNVIMRKWLPQSDLIGFALKDKGHNITMLSHFAEDTNLKNFTLIKLEDSVDQFDDLGFDILSHSNHFKNIKIVYDWSKFCCKQDLTTTGLSTLMKYPDDFKFDLIILDLTLEPCLYPIIDRFKNPPVVAVTPFLLPPTFSLAFGNLLQTSFMPFYTTTYSDKMSFTERFVNFCLVHFELLYRKYIVFPEEFAMAKKYFGNNISLFEVIERNISILLTNTEPNLEYPLAFSPNIIPVGGLHIQPAKPLPEDLKKIMDKSKNGIIVFSLGSVFRSDTMSLIKIRMILDAFAGVSETVIWKFESETLNILPKNVLIRKWLPQNDLLAHPNTKLLINHGGALSTQEAMYHGVPVVSIPFFADQFANAGRLQNKNMSKIVDYKTMTTESFYETITEVLNNPMYRKNIQTLSKRYRDRLNTPLETAVFWVEYVLRHGSAEHLGLAARDMYFYEVANLDIYAVLLLGLYVIYCLISLMFTLLKAIVRLII
ncbi:hypothetical protein FQR65_LT09053 [Abscondita terminalis]|nr:hypothetical protein FQR65_LT09053 [Abscondita terminalis]